MPLNRNDKIITELYHKMYGKIVSYITSIIGFHHLETAEDIAQDTLTDAFTTWGENAIPEKPEAWLFRVAKNKTVNYIKRQKIKEKVYNHTFLEQDIFTDEAGVTELIEDSMLRMMLACCHPSISSENQITLILKALCGFSRKEISTALLTKEETIKKRLVAVKKQVISQSIKLEMPENASLNKRLDMVCTCLYLLFNEGYNSTHSKEIIRKELCLEAMGLCRLIAHKIDNYPKANALMALMCFHTARFDSRIDDSGTIVLFQNQDRKLWSNELIDAGIKYLSSSQNSEVLSSYHIEAAIAAEHCFAKSFETTNWKYIYSLYEKLYQLKQNPIIQLNLAIISSRLDGVESSIEKLNRLKVESKPLSSYYLLYATLGELYKTNGDKESAKLNYQQALELTHSAKEKEFLQQKISAIAN
jgi:RNA polymerase sigma-70 factor (ECF subfamily)